MWRHTAARLLQEQYARLKAKLPRVVRMGRSRSRWIDTLGGLSADLHTLSTDTENEFLSIGESLQDFYTRSREISGASSSVSGLMGGEEVEKVIEGFRNVATRIEAMQAGSQRSLGEMGALVETLHAMQSGLAGFNRIVRVLNILCISTRVESARLGEGDIGFSELAVDVKKLGADIESKCGRLYAQSVLLKERITQALSRVSEIEAKQQAQARLAIENIMSELAALGSQREHSSEAARKVSVNLDAITGSIGEIVTSIQFQDIIRQRVEHVRNAIDSIVAGKPEDSPSANMDEFPLQLCIARDVCMLQSAQLRSARNGMVSAVSHIVDHLRKISENIALISQEMRQVATLADESGHSFLSSIDLGFSAIASALTVYQAADTELASVAKAIRGALQEMASFTSEIEGIGHSIKLIALNAIVKSCHIGDSGAAVMVLAEAIHELSIEACQRTASVTDTLTSIISTADGLTAGLEAESEGGISELEAIRQSLEEYKRTLGSVNGNVLSLLEKVNIDGLSLSEDIHCAAENIDVHSRFELTADGVGAQLQELAAELSKLAPEGAIPQSASHLESLVASYTMQGERDIHGSFGNPDPAPPAALPSTPQEADGYRLSLTERNDPGEGEVEQDAADDELGDNVEFF